MFQKIMKTLITIRKSYVNNELGSYHEGRRKSSKDKMNIINIHTLPGVNLNTL